MAEPIKVGDLVMVIKATPCGCAQAIGMIYRVAKVRLCAAGIRCVFCGSEFPEDVLAENSSGSGAQPYRLKRIPPLDELESETRDERITA